MGEAVAKPQDGPRGQRVVAPHDGDQRLVGRGDDRKVRCGRGTEDHRKVDVEFRERVEGLAMAEDAHIEAHLREIGPVGGDLLGQEPVGEGVAAGQRDLAAAKPREVLDLRADAARVGDLVADVADEEFTGRIQAHAARQPVEEGRPQLLLHVLEAAVEGRCGDVEAFGGLPDGAGAGDLVDIAPDLEMPHVVPLALTDAVSAADCRKLGTRRQRWL